MIQDRKIIINWLSAEEGMKVNADFDNIQVNANELNTLRFCIGLDDKETNPFEINLIKKE